MNLKLRFALLLTLFVALILAVSSFTIYILNYNLREVDFYRRVKTEALQFHNLSLLNKGASGPSFDQYSNLLRKSTVYDERVVIMDTCGRVSQKMPDTLHFTLSPKILNSIRTQKEYNWYSDDGYQNVGLLIEDTPQILVSSGYDKSGYNKLAKLKMILIIVFIGGVLITAFLAFFFVQQAFKPLTKLSMQMNMTNSQNLAQRIPVSDTRDEINDIARNFNGMLERLGRAFEFQKSFVYHASHELRTPLATMLSQTELALQKTPSEEGYKSILLSLQEDQQGLIELTNSLLAISQADQIEQQQNWPLLRIDEVLYESISSCKRMLPQVTINMSFGSIPETDDDFMIRGNDSLLKSVFSNLIKNANNYSIDHKVDITLESDGDTIFIHFDNTGTQLPADEKENIMIPFFRGGNAMKTKGYGLGLSIVYRFITIHKGTITYTPIANDVNRFTITLYKAGSLLGQS